MKSENFAKIGIGIWFITLAGLMVMVWFFPFITTESVDSVEAGQVWVIGSEDPFNPWCHTNTVLDVKEGYVLYHTGTREDSDNIGYFVMGSTRIK